MIRNPELFELCAGLSMADLYERFPLSTDINFKSLYSEISARFPDASMEEYIKVFLVIQNTFQWLSVENFIRFDSINENWVHSAQLTEKGLRILKVVPKGLDKKSQSIAEFLTKSSKAGEKEAFMVINTSGSL